MNWQVVFEGRGFTPVGQPPVRFQISRLRWNAFGGADIALIKALGSQTTLEGLAARLGCPLTVYNQSGQPVWWGFFFGLSSQYGKITMDGMANRVAVYHTSLSPLYQPGESNLTPWAEDALSQARFGIIEKIIRRGHIDERFALQLRDLSLSQLKTPQVRPTEAKLAPGEVLLECRGWMHTLGRKYYQTTAGMIGNTAAQQGTQAFGNTSGSARLAQSFIPGADISVNSADLRLRREGSPTDALTVSIQTDSSGLPSGSVLGSASVNGSLLESESYPWVRFSFDPSVTLAAGSRYWLVLSRSAALSSSNYYWVSMDEQLSFGGGYFKIYDQASATWGGRTPPADLMFKILGLQETSLQLGDIYDAGNQFFSGFDCRVSSGVLTPPYEVRMDTCLAVFQRLLVLGTVNKRLMTAMVTHERKLIIEEQPVPGERDFWVDSLGRYNDQFGNRLMPGKVPVGEWVRHQAAPNVEPVFLKETEINFQ